MLAWLVLARLAPRPRRAFLRLAREAVVRLPADAAGAKSARCALRAFFHALRAAAESFRARLASRLASFTRLRARLSSSLAIRRRCFATSACSLARSRGSAGSPVAGASRLAPGAAAFAPSPAPDNGAPADRFSRTDFPMQMASRGRDVTSLTQWGRPCHLDLIRLRGCWGKSPFRARACFGRGRRSHPAQRARAGSIVAVTRLRPEFLLR